MDSTLMENSAKQDSIGDDNHMELLLSPQSTIAPHSKVVGAATNTNLNDPMVKRNAPARVEEFEVPDSVEMLDSLLQQNHVDANTKDRQGKTLLLKSVNIYRNDSFIMHLLNENFDPNVSDKYNETPLHDAVTRPASTIAHELLKRGADVNATTNQRRTPLHQAVDYNNVEAVCLLLYYGADANVLSKNNTTPFMYALSYRDVESSEILINYHDCLNDVPYSCSALYYATQHKSPLAGQLIEMGSNVNFVTQYGENLLIFSLFYDDATLFKLMWPRYDYGIILNSARPFLLSYLTNCCFSTTDWGDCLYLILSSPIASELIQHYECFTKNEAGTFFHELLRGFHRKNINLPQRLSFIYIALSVGAKVNIRDINTVYMIYGFSDELDILIYFLEDDTIANKYTEMKWLLLPFILALEDEFDLRTAQVVFQSEPYENPAHDWLGFFSRSCYASLFETIPRWWKSDRLKINERLHLLPEFPSLFELSRNQARKFVRQACRITRPYHFHDAVKSLNLPDYIKDVIRFKVPIYK